MITQKKETHPEATILVITLGCILIYKFLHLEWFFRIAVVIGLCGIFSPWLSRKIEWVWLKFSDILSRIFPKILLGLVFYLILYPLSLLARISGKDPLMLKNQYKSYFRDHNSPTDKSSFEKIW